MIHMEQAQSADLASLADERMRQHRGIHAAAEGDHDPRTRPGQSLKVGEHGARERIGRVHENAPISSVARTTVAPNPMAAYKT